MFNVCFHAHFGYFTQDICVLPFCRVFFFVPRGYFFLSFFRRHAMTSAAAVLDFVILKLSNGIMVIVACVLCPLLLLRTMYSSRHHERPADEIRLTSLIMTRRFLPRDGLLPVCFPCGIYAYWVVSWWGYSADRFRTLVIVCC